MGQEMLCCGKNLRVKNWRRGGIDDEEFIDDSRDDILTDEQMHQLFEVFDEEDLYGFK